MKCKLNDLAFINNALRPVNIGLVVTCSTYLGYYLAGDIIEINKEHYTAHISDNYWIITNTHGMIETQFGKSVMSYQPDTWLTPITPPELETDEELFLTLADEVTA
jgi:hypothetical protein